MKPKFGDFIVISVVLMTALGIAWPYFGLFTNDQPVAHVIQNNEVVAVIRLSPHAERTVIELEGDYHNIIISEGGKIWFASADCPDRTCVRMGQLSRPGQLAACIPNRVIVKVVSETVDDVDVYLQ